MVKLLTEATPAKINLFLRVVGRRPDGYHELDSVFVPISLYDRLKIEIRTAPEASVAVQCDCQSLPTDDQNLASRAAKAFMTEFGRSAQVTIDLHKEIPVGAGLGGGSSDAGAVLRMMSALERIDGAKRLRKLALKLGADVPFFLRPASARIGGIGERITPITAPLKLALVVAVAPFQVSTAAVYQELSPEQWSGRAPEADLAAIESGRISGGLLVNDLAAVAIARYPKIAELKAMLEVSGARAAAMTGSGSAVFGIFGDMEKAALAAEGLSRRAAEARIFTATSLDGDWQLSRGGAPGCGTLLGNDVDSVNRRQ